jgi:hypothetical protein
VARSEGTPDDKFSALGNARFRDALQSKVRVSISNGEFVMRLPGPNLIAGGPSYETALDELVELAEQQPV